MVYLDQQQNVQASLTILEPRNKLWKELVTNYDLCLTGDGLSYLHRRFPKLYLRLLPHVKVTYEITKRLQKD